MGKTHRGTPPPKRRPSRRGAAPFFISLHAFEQFRDRVCPQLSPARAKAECVILARRCERTEGRVGTGDEIWEPVDGEPVQFVVKEDRGSRICVTVLAASQRR